MSPAAELLVDTLVALKGLEKTSHLNGRRGIVVSVLNSNGRIGVQLFPKHEKRIVFAKPSNLVKEGIQLESAPIEIRHHENCDNCGESRPWKSMQVCSKCKVVCYCSRKCQQAHWQSKHKAVCQAFRELRKDPNRTNIQLSPADRTAVWCGISNIHRAKEDRPAAEKVLRDGIEEHVATTEHLIPLHNSLSMLYLEHGCLDEAVEELRVAVAIADDDTLPHKPSCAFTIHKNLGALLFKQGDYDAALAEYEKTVELGPVSVSDIQDGKHLFDEIRTCCVRKAASCKCLGDLDGAMRYYQQAIAASRTYLLSHHAESGREHAVAHSKLASCLHMKVEYLLTHAEEQISSDLTLSFEEDLNECVEHWTMAAELDPTGYQHIKDAIVSGHWQASLNRVSSAKLNASASGH